MKTLGAAGFGASALAAYLCGLSVECVLRSLIPPDEDFYDHHDFVTLARLGALTLADDAAYKRLGTLLNELAILWKNTLRFYPDDLFAAFCKKRARSIGLRIDRGARPATVVCRRLLQLSDLAFTECEILWLK